MDHIKDIGAELHQTLESRRLELAYMRECRKVEAICEAEKFRQLRVQLLLLEGDNGDLHAQLAQEDGRIDDLERRSEELHEELNASQCKLKSAQGDLANKCREIETLKAELNSLHGVMMDSTKLLTEKLTLARELASLKPELDHLRVQVASHQTLLAEKLSLQRRLSIIQVELETEKRSTQRTLAKEDKSQVADVKLQSRVESLQADLVKERRERQKIERDAQKTSTELENKKNTLESRLDAFRNKLKTTKEQLKEMQIALQKAEAAAQAASARAAASAKPAILAARNPRKRAAVEMDADTMIGTPGDLPATKRNKKSTTLPGEKSMFSITPFLNRTASRAPDSPASEDDGKEGEHAERPTHSPSRTSKPNMLAAATASEPLGKGTSTISSVQARNPGVLEIVKESKANSRPLPVRRSKTAPGLEQVTEEENDENSTSTTAAIKPMANESVPDDTTIARIETKQKKRRLLGGSLGKTLFDEDDGDAVKGDQRLLGAIRSFSTQVKRGPGGAEFGLRKGLGTSTSGFGAISPLKKDRKGK